MTNIHQLITSESNTLIDLLVAQCADLQGLLALARREMNALKENDFDQLVSINSERAQLGERLESYHRQIAELRDVMGETGDRIVAGNVAREAVKVITEIQSTDQSSQTALESARTETSDELKKLERGQRNSAAYLQDSNSQALNFDHRA